MQPGKRLELIVRKLAIRCIDDIADHLPAPAGIISREDGLASGLDSSFVQRADKYGGGFLVNVEGMHHLHCLVWQTSRILTSQG